MQTLLLLFKGPLDNFKPSTITIETFDHQRNRDTRGYRCCFTIDSKDFGHPRRRNKQNIILDHIEI